MPTPRLFGNAHSEGYLDGDVRLHDHTYITADTTLIAHDDAQIVCTGDTHIHGVTLTLEHGQACFRNADIRTDEDFILIRPAGDPHLWTAHRTADDTWVVHAGCVHNIPLDRPWDSTTTPDTTTPDLDDARQDTFDMLARTLAATGTTPHPRKQGGGVPPPAP